MTLNELERLADAATPGPWHSPGLGEVHCKHPDFPDGCIEVVSVVFPNEYNDNEGGMQEDADFIAAANPATIKELVQLVKQCKEALETTQRLGINSRTFEALAAIEKWEKK